MSSILALLSNKYLWAAAAGALLIGAAAVWHSSKVSEAEQHNYDRGMKAERLVWQVRLTEEVTAANRKYVELQEKYRALEKKSAEDIAAIATKLQKEKSNVEKQRDKALTDARAGMDFRLRWAASCAPTRKDPGGDSTPTAGADPGSAGGTATCELPDPLKAALIGLASDADEVTIERNALLEVAKKDREVCR